MKNLIASVSLCCALMLGIAGLAAYAQGPGGLGVSLVTDGTTTLTGIRQLAFTCDVAISSGGTGTGIANANSGAAPRAVTETANYTIPATACGTAYNNVGATGSVTLTLPAAAPGLSYTFTVDASQTVEVLRAGSDQIAIGASNSSSNNVTSSGPYATLTIYAYKTGQWVASSSTGTWVVH